VSCQTSGTCTAVDRACPGERGHVTCGTTTYTCPACCTDGQHRQVFLGSCCDDPPYTGLKEQQVCVNGVWVPQYQFCGASAQCVGPDP
jgi:hypothetical protein